MTAHEIDYKIYGEEMQFVEIELDPQEGVVAESGSFMMMDDGIKMETIFGDGSQKDKGFLGKILGAGKRILTGESLFMTAFYNNLTGKRNVSWRADKPATLYWVEALDGGNPAIDVAYRDEVFELAAPFNGTPNSLIKTKQRFAGIIWGNDNTAVAYDYWWNTRNLKIYIFNPSKPGNPVIFSDRNYQDVYSDPGNFVSSKNELVLIKKIENDDSH